MTKAEALQFYGTQQALADALGVRQPTVSKWIRLPAMRQIQLQAKTGGALKADADVLPANAELVVHPQ